MRERAALIGAELEIRSRRGRGTTVLLTVETDAAAQNGESPVDKAPSGTHPRTA
jgi:hypothetical protein